MTTPLLVSLVDDDESVRESLPDLLREFGFAVQAFASAPAFLDSDCLAQTRCLILDVAMPEMSGPELQKELARETERRYTKLSFSERLKLQLENLKSGAKA